MQSSAKHEDTSETCGVCLFFKGHFRSQETWKWTVAIVGPDGGVWGIPGNARRVLRISSGHTELVGPVLEGDHKWHSAVLAPDGCPAAESMALPSSRRPFKFI